MTKSAGEALRETLNDALTNAARAAGQPLEFSEHELLTLDRACAAADRAEELRNLFNALRQNPETNPNVLTKLSAEIRMLDRQVVDLANMVNPDIGQAKSSRHVKAARTRWGA